MFARTPSFAGRVAAALVTASLAVAAVACSGSTSPDASAASNVLAALPAPPSATIVVGQSGPGADGDARFYAYTSGAAPKEERAAYGSLLAAAGYKQVRSAGNWTAYARNGVTVWVSISTSGPPTSIIALVSSDPTSAALPAALATDPASTALLGNVTTPRPPTPEPVTRPETPSPAPQGSPAPATASPDPTSRPTPSASPEPTQTPKPTHKPRPTQKPKPSHKPKPTPKPKPSHGPGTGGTTQ